MISTKDNPVVDKEEETSMITASVVMDVGNVPADESRARSSKKHKESERSRSWESDGSWRSDDSGDWSSTMEVHMQSMSKGCCERIKWWQILVIVVLILVFVSSVVGLLWSGVLQKSPSEDSSPKPVNAMGRTNTLGVVVDRDSFELHSNTMQVSTTASEGDTVRLNTAIVRGDFNGLNGIAMGSRTISSQINVLVKWTLKPLLPPNNVHPLGYAVIGIVDSRWTQDRWNKANPLLPLNLHYYGQRMDGLTQSNGPRWDYEEQGHGFMSEDDQVIIELDLRNQQPTLRFVNEGYGPTTVHVLNVDFSDGAGHEIEYKLFVAGSNENSGFQIVDYTVTTATVSPTT